MARTLVAALAGLVFGAGLAVSQMIDPAKVLAFLDLAAIADGRWDPSLALVMAGALGVTAVGYRLAFRRRRPLCAEAYAVPTRRTVDGRLVAGAVLFGAGWGLVGYCPGPAIAGLGFGVPETWVFVAAMLVGMAGFRLIVARRRDGTAAASGSSR
ncbi:MAG: DUF6691 family protein [Rhodospirillales bacterium]